MFFVIAFFCLVVSAACVGRCNRVARADIGEAVASAIAGFLFFAAGALWAGNAVGL